jgi:hypothetical protein
MTDQRTVTIHTTKDHGTDHQETTIHHTRDHPATTEKIEDHKSSTDMTVIQLVMTDHR